MKAKGILFYDSFIGWNNTEKYTNHGYIVKDV